MRTATRDAAPALQRDDLRSAGRARAAARRGLGRRQRIGGRAHTARELLLVHRARTRTRRRSRRRPINTLDRQPALSEAHARRLPPAAADPGPFTNTYVAAHAAPFTSTDGAGRGLRLLRRGERLAGHVLDRRGARAAARGQAHRRGVRGGLRTVPRVRIRYERCPEGRRGPLLPRALHERQRDEHAVLQKLRPAWDTHHRGGRRRAGRRRQDAGPSTSGRARAALGRPHHFLCVGDARAGRPPQRAPSRRWTPRRAAASSGAATERPRGVGGVEAGRFGAVDPSVDETRVKGGRAVARLDTGPGAAWRLCLRVSRGMARDRFARRAAHLSVGAGGRGSSSRPRRAAGSLVQRDGRNGSEATGRDAGGVRGRNGWWGWRAPRGGREHAGPAKGVGVVLRQVTVGRDRLAVAVDARVPVLSRVQLLRCARSHAV